MSEQTFLRSHKSVMDTFHQAAATQDMSVYDRMFGKPVRHQLDVGALAEAELEPKENKSPVRTKNRNGFPPAR